MQKPMARSRFTAEVRRALRPAIESHYNNLKVTCRDDEFTAKGLAWFIDLIGRAESGQIKVLNTAGLKTSTIQEFYIYRDTTEYRSLRFTIDGAEFTIYNTLKALGTAYRQASRA